MSEDRTESSGTSPADDRRRPDQDPGQDPGQDKDDFKAGTGYQPSTNQARDEPLPASHHDDGRQEGTRRRGEPVRDEQSPGQGGRGQADRGQAGRGA